MYIIVAESCRTQRLPDSVGASIDAVMAVRDVCLSWPPERWGNAERLIAIVPPIGQLSLARSLERCVEVEAVIN